MAAQWDQTDSHIFAFSRFVCVILYDYTCYNRIFATFTLNKQQKDG